MSVVVHLRDKYSEDQPRDESGRWTDGGGSSSGASGDPGSGGSSINEDERSQFRISAVREQAGYMSAIDHFDAARIDVVDQAPRAFTVGTRQFNEAGHFDPATGRIQLNARVLADLNTSAIKGVASHEIMHAQQDHVDRLRAAEHAVIKALPTDEYARLFQANGYARPEARGELAFRYPASAAYARTWGDSYLNEEADKDNYTAMMKEDGVSEYSKAYWAPEAMRGSGSLARAVGETLAEVRRVNQPALRNSADSTPSKRWARLERDLTRVYRKTRTAS